MAIMDFPQAWAFVEASNMDDHHGKCSWRTHSMLCDCHVLNDEYKRRSSE